jgi:hypothetical protein
VGFPRLEPPGGAEPETRQAIGAVDTSRLKSRPEIVSVDRIWDASPHNGFTGLIRFRERWYCTFREGADRVSPEGTVRVITSADGVNWATTFHIASEYADIRDPKLSITHDQRLMLSALAAYNPPTEINHQTLAWYSLDGREWGIPFKIGDPEVALWDIAWHRGNAYSLAHSTTQDSFIRMYMGPAGLRFQMLEDRVREGGRPTEAALLFSSDDSALSLLTQEGGGETALLGLSRPPYRGWTWRDLGVPLRGADFIRIPDGRIVVGARPYVRGRQTALLWLDEEEGAVEPILTLPSGGDNGYPGLAFHDGLLWVSYHSSHEDKTAVYLAKVRLPEKEKESFNELPTY